MPPHPRTWIAALPHAARRWASAVAPGWVAAAAFAADRPTKAPQPDGTPVPVTVAMTGAGIVSSGGPAPATS